MDNPQAERPRFRDWRVTPPAFKPCYALLAETFAADVLESAAVMKADLAALAGGQFSVQYVMLARSALPGGSLPQTEPLISLVAGCYLSLAGSEFAGCGIGFIEYLATRPAFQRQGHASAMLQAFEQEMARIAASRSEQLRLVLGEIEPEMLAYKIKRGYHWPSGSLYAQPPISFDAQSGDGLSPAVPKMLMVKAWDGAVTTALLLSAVQAILEKRYLPRAASEQAIRKAREYIRQHVFEPFASSLKMVGEYVAMD